MTDDVQNLQQQIQQQTVQSAQNFYGESLGRLKSQLQNDRAQLESLAEQVPSEEAQAQIQELVDSYEAIESSLDQSAQDLGVEDAVNQALQQAQEAVGQEAGQVGQVAQGVQETAGRAADQVGQTAEGLAPGTQLLGKTTNEAGQTVQRTVDESGNIVESTLDEAGNPLEENPVGNITDLETVEEYQTEEGQTVRTVREESGSLIRLQLGRDSSILDLAIPEPKEEVTEETVEQGSQAQSGGGQEEPDATKAARQRAEEIGVDLSQVEGSGSEGRITVKDVMSAANQE